jgi:hypothetical protein
METDFKTFFNELKKYLVDELNNATEMREFNNGAISAICRIMDFIDNPMPTPLESVKIEEKQEEKEDKPYSDTPPITEPADRCGRPRERLLIADGHDHAFKCGQDMLEYFDLMQYYGKFMHLFQRKGGRENLVEYEANALRKLLWEKWQIRLDSYTAHGFDGLAHTIMFEKEEEKENA